MRKKRLLSLLLTVAMVFSMMVLPATAAQGATLAQIGDMTALAEDGNVLTFSCDKQEVTVELCTDRTARIQLSLDGANGYRPEDPQYYMVQKNIWDPVDRTVTEEDGTIKIRTDAMEIRVQKSPLRIGMYDLEGNLLSKDADDQGIYWDDSGVRGVKRVEGAKNAGGIFGFGSGDHGRRSNLNRYGSDFTEFSMSHGRLIAPFFMSTVGYGVFLNTIEKETKFFKQGGGFQTKGYLDYFFMYGPDFKTILNEYAEITGRMELYGKWAHGFMLSKYGNDNATQKEFLEWLHRLRDEGYPTDCYVFDYGWRGDVADNGNPQHGAGEKWGKQMWSNDTNKFPDIDAMFKEADELGFHVGLHNNAGTPEASGGKELYKPEYEEPWVQSYMDSVITTGYGDWFWPDEFDVLGSNTAPTFSSKGAYEAWQAYTDESRPMFVTRGSYAGQHFATAWSGDINNTSAELDNQIGFSIDAGLVGYWTSSNDLGGFMKRPSNELYTRWVSEFGAWSGMMRTHGHDGREPWTFDQTAQDTLKQNLQVRYALYPYTYSLAWQGYSQGVPMMRAMLLEDGSQYNPAAWDINKQYYYGDWFLVAPASATTDTTVKVWLPPETTWYNYYTGERYEGGPIGKNITVAAALEEIPVFVKSGAIVPMGPDVNYADEKPLDPLTLDIYPKGKTSFTLYEDDGQSRKYITENAYSTTTFESIQDGTDISFKIHERVDNNPAVYTPDARSYNLKFNHIAEISGVTINGTAIEAADSLEAYNAAEQAYWLDTDANTVYVRTPDTGKAIDVVFASGGIVEPELGDENEGNPPTRITDGSVIELEETEMLPASGGEVKPDNEWKGYTGSGFAKGFKAVGDAVQFDVNVETAGTYDLVLRVNNGKKNAPQYDSTPRTGGLYIQNQKAADLAFAVTDKWGETVDGVKQGVWVDYTYRVKLESGVTTMKIRAEGSNPGNYNLDSLTFRYVDTSVNAFSKIEAETASHLEGGAAVAADTAASGGSKLAVTENGAWAQFDEVRGSQKSGLALRVKSTTGGSIVVYENGVGDKILATLEIPADGKWTTLTSVSKDTDAMTSNIYLSFVAKEGAERFDCDVDWFHFTTDKATIDAYSQIEAETANERHGIDTTTKTISGQRYTLLNHIEDGDWAKFSDVNFGEGGVVSFETQVAAGLQGGMLEVRLDSVNGVKAAEVEIAPTGNWDTLKVYSGDCMEITGIHDVYLKFVNTFTTSSICDMDWIKFISNRKVIDAFSQIEAETADERQGIDTTSKTVDGKKITLLNHIENGDWAKFNNVDFGDGDAASVEVRVAAGLQGGTMEVRLDAVDGEKIAEVQIANTGDWNTLKTYTGACGTVVGTHDVYLKFVNTETASSICDMDWFRFKSGRSSVSTGVTGGSATVTVTPESVKVGDTATVRISNIEMGKKFQSISAVNAEGGAVALTEVVAGKEYTFVVPDSTRVDVTVTLEEGENDIESGSVFELENARGDTSSNNGDGSGKVRVDTEWKGYTGSGYVAGWKAVGHFVEFDVNVKQAGMYDLVLRAACGKKNGAQFDNTPRTGALYVDGVKVKDFALEIHQTWGEWFDEVLSGVVLTEGKHTIKIRSEGSANSGNFNLDSLRFDRVSGLEKQVLTVQYGTNAKLSVEGAYEALIERDGMLGATVYAGDKLTLTFTPANGPFASAQLNGEDIPFEADGCTYTFTMPNDKASLRFVFTSVNKDILETLLEKANEVTDEQLDKLVESVRAKFIAARDNAQKVFESDKATQDEVNEAWKELLDAMHYLSFEEGTKDELKYWLDYAAELDLDNFTPKSQEGYAEALAYAEEIYNDEGETLKAEVEKAAKNLHEAILRLEFKANTETLEAFVKQAQEIEIDKYLDGPEKDKFNEILPQAEALLEDANATQNQVDEMADALYEAMMNLRMIPDKEALKALIDESEALNPEDYTAASYAILRAALNNALNVYEDESATQEEITAVCATVEKARAGLVPADKPEEPAKPDNKPSNKPSNSGSSGSKKPAGNVSGTGTAVAVTNPVISAAQNVMGQKSVRSDTTANFTLKRGSAYCFKMTVVNGSNTAPSFTVGNGNVLKTQFVAKIGNDCYYRVWAVGTPGDSTGVYTTMAGEKAQQHCVVTVG
ncbi:carbohydrate-binding protein [Clostridium sp. D33t1_170424_F3]|uniref:carbohydrate-binding protein n=1 Tax=Clostridium sp. D33t1_170424_F3 TaxID=2787099 RepID=UPI0018A9C38B|nr:carbohydrate-binding protein [Clostridium sp. D33t1_170424_F3]